GFLFEANVYDICALKLTALAQHRFFTRVVLAGIKRRLISFDVPTGEGTGGFTDVLFGVMADAEAEQFHQLAGVVLVRIAFLAAARVEPDHHGRVLRHLLQHGAKTAKSVAAEQFVLPQHEAGVAHLLVAGSKMVVPAESQFFPKWMGGVQHPIQPPRASLLAVVGSRDAVRQSSRVGVKLILAGTTG